MLKVAATKVETPKEVIVAFILGEQQHFFEQQLHSHFRDGRFERSLPATLFLALNAMLGF